MSSRNSSSRKSKSNSSRLSRSSRSSSNNRPAKTRRIGSEPGILTYLEHQLSRIFSDLTISVNNVSGEIHGFSCIDDKKCECFNLVIDQKAHNILIDRVRYKYGEDCALSGTDIMTRLVGVFQHKGFPYKVQLYDRARVQLDKKHEILLSIHYIILHGIPWYAKFGFRTPQYDNEVAVNEATMNKTITPMVLKRINAHLSPENAVQKGTTFRQAAKMLSKTQILAYLELYNYLADEKAKRLKYAYYDMWLVL
jgi:hypothetical protein